MNKPQKQRVAVLGASSFVGQSLLPLLISANCRISAFSRNAVPQSHIDVYWAQLLQAKAEPHIHMQQKITLWISVAPIWVLADYLPWIKNMGAKRVVVLSSTSKFTKTRSTDVNEQGLAKRISDSEQHFIDWAEDNGIEWVILRPTLIYGFGLDKNLSEIARFIRRFFFFPVFGPASGLRQPVHVADVAQACVAALTVPTSNRAYNLSGGETLTYKEMVFRVFKTLGRRPRFISVPLPFFHITVALLRWLPRYRKWSFAMAERMNQNLVFDHTEAQKDLGFSPRNFNLSAAELPE